MTSRDESLEFIELLSSLDVYESNGGFQSMLVENARCYCDLVNRDLDQLTLAETSSLIECTKNEYRIWHNETYGLSKTI